MAQSTRSARTTRPARASRGTSQARTRHLANVRSRRKQPQKKGLATTLTGLLPTGAAAKATPGSKKGKAGGFAALAGAAGLAFRNRDKLTSMFGRKDEAQDMSPATPETPPTPATPSTDAAGPRPVDTTHTP